MNRTEAAAKARAARAAKTPPLETRFWSKVDRRGADECWPWLAAVRRKDEGYGAFYVDGRHRPAPRVAWTLTHGPIAPGLVVCHRCDNPRCCNPAHLFLGTPQDNDADRVAKGRQARGSRNAASRLREWDVWFIRRMRARLGAEPSTLARAFRITPAYVWELCKTPVWTHVRDDDAAHIAEAHKRWDDWKKRSRDGRKPAAI